MENYLCLLPFLPSNTFVFFSFNLTGKIRMQCEANNCICCFISFASTAKGSHRVSGPVLHPLSLLAGSTHPTAHTALLRGDLLSKRGLPSSLLIHYNFHFLSVVVWRKSFSQFHTVRDSTA